MTEISFRTGEGGGIRSARAYQAIAQDIRDRIISGSLRVGERLPSETKLARDINVSRSTVREAFRTLEEAGYIERPSPKVMVVRSTTGEPAEREFTKALRRSNITMDELYEALHILEPEVARLAATRTDPAILLQLNRNLEAQESDVHDYEKWAALDEEFHLLIAEMSGNSALILARAPILDLILPIFKEFAGLGQAERGLAFHRRIYQFLERADPDAVANTMRQHVQDSRVAWDMMGFDFSTTLTDWERESQARKAVEDNNVSYGG